MACILALSTIVVVSAATLSRYGVSNNNDGKIRRTTASTFQRNIVANSGFLSTMVLDAIDRH
jgi:hypothetical protein